MLEIGDLKFSLHWVMCPKCKQGNRKEISDLNIEVKAVSRLQYNNRRNALSTVAEETYL